MKAGVVQMGSPAAAVAAVVGSVALSLLILHPPADGLLPWAAPADGEHATALLLPAPRASRTTAATPLERPVPAPAKVTLAPTHKASRPATHSATPAKHRAPSPPPPTQTTPTPVTQPVPTPTPAPPPPVTQPAATKSNGRWSAAAKIKTWQGAAAKQATRTQQGKPPWAAAKHTAATATTDTTPTQTVAAQAVTPEAAKIPPGQAKTNTPPGQAKKAQ